SRGADPRRGSHRQRDARGGYAHRARHRPGLAARCRCVRARGGREPLARVGRRDPELRGDLRRSAARPFLHRQRGRMKDRVPAPLLDHAGDAPSSERASATTARVLAFERKAGAEEGTAPAKQWASLRELQERMVEAITGSDAVADNAALRLTPGPRLTARERL